MFKDIAGIMVGLRLLGLRLGLFSLEQFHSSDASLFLESELDIELDVDVEPMILRRTKVPPPEFVKSPSGRPDSLKIMVATCLFSL